jgi:hypothetical protein
MGPVLHPADINEACPFVQAEGDAVVAATRYTPSCEFEPQRLRQPGWVTRKRRSDELRHRGGDFVR